MLFHFTRAQALSLGLLTCKCGHPPNNHFDFGSDRRPCAHCHGECKDYTEKARGGGILLSEEVEREVKERDWAAEDSWAEALIAEVRACYTDNYIARDARKRIEVIIAKRR